MNDADRVFELGVCSTLHMHVGDMLKDVYMVTEGDLERARQTLYAGRKLRVGMMEGLTDKAQVSKEVWDENCKQCDEADEFDRVIEGIAWRLENEDD